MNTKDYLTKIEVDFEMAYRIGLRDSYAWHQKVWQAFPGRDGMARDFITRLDTLENGFRLLLLSQHKPTRPDWCPGPAWASKMVPASFYTQNCYRFSLLANPTKKIRSNTAGQRLKNSRRVPIAARDALLDWLERKAEQSGFSFERTQTRTISRPRLPFIKKGTAGLHCATEFISTLRVTNAARFRHAVTNGIGPAKAFGLGMLCLSPVASCPP